MTGKPEAPDAGLDVFASTLRDAIRARGLSLERVRYHLAVRGHELSIATLSYWQSGRSRPERAASLAALADLEEVLEVAPGTLSAPLIAVRGRPAWPLPTPPPAVQAPPAGEEAAVPGRRSPESDEARERDELAARMGLAFDDSMAYVSIQDIVEVRPDRSIGRRRFREVLTAQVDGLTRFPVSAQCRSNGPPQLVVGEANCHVAQMLDATTGGLVVAEIALDAPLRSQESAVVEYRVDPLGPAHPGSQVERTLAHPVELYIFDLRFPAGDPPVAISFSGWRAGRQVMEQLPVAGEHQVIALENVEYGRVFAWWCW